MDAGLATLPTPPSNSSVPYDIYLPLLQIAKAGYDANNVKCWYAIILDQLLHADLTYPVSTSDSSSIALVPSLDGTMSSGADTSTIGSTLCPAEYVGGSDTQHLDPFDSLSFDPSATNDVTASPHSTPSMYETPTPAHDGTSHFDFHPSPSYRAPSTPLPVMTQAGLSTPLYNSTNFTNNTHPYNVWPQSEHLDGEPSRKRSISQTSHYEFHTPMPLLAPSTESSSPLLSSSLAPVYTSTELMYLPPISIIPSRKRRKAGSKGVKKFIQPLHVSRQSI